MTEILYLEFISHLSFILCDLQNVHILCVKKPARKESLEIINSCAQGSTYDQSLFFNRRGRYL